jgi:hypothetical protein
MRGPTTMKSEIKKIIDLAYSHDADESEEAILQLAMLLEKNSPFADSFDFYKSIMAPQLFEVCTNQKDLEEIVDELIRLMSERKSSISILSALRGTTLPSAFQFFLNLLCNNVHKMNEESIRQVLLGIDNFLPYEETDTRHAQFDRYLRGCDYSKPLLKIIKRGNPELTELANKLMVKLAQGRVPDIRI